MEHYVLIKPVIIYPECVLEGRRQDCLHCHIWKQCPSPRGMCTYPYPGYQHKYGCPNYNRKKGCPPHVRMYDEVYDINEPVYAIYNIFDLKSQVERMRSAHPNWSYRQLANCLYWQEGARKILFAHIYDFLREHRGEGYRVETSPEAMGVNVTETMKNAGIILEWPPENVAYQVALAGIRKNVV